jgi:heat shock protein HslJ
VKDWIVAALLAASLAIAGCSPPPAEGWVELPSGADGTGEILRITGTVHKLDVEGGVFVIRDEEGTRYNPTNLPQAFRTNGIAVEIEARRRDDMVSIGMVGPLIELIRIRKHAEADATRPALTETAWRLEDLAGAGIVAEVQATLEFTDDGRIGGKGSCNSFGGPVRIGGDTIRVGPLAATQMACAESAAMDQEARYLAALQQAERFEIQPPYLYIYSAGQPQPLRFIAADDPVVAQLSAQADAWDKAIVRKDRAAIEANMAEDFRQIDGRGSVETKDSGRYQGEPFASHYRYIDIYARRGDDWKIVSVQITQIPEET